MGNTNRTWASILITVIAFSCISLLAVTPANAQTAAKPSAPEFTVQVIDGGYQIDILNQPVVPNGHDTAGIFYNIRIKSHTADNWVNTTVPDPTQGKRGYIPEIGQSGYTTLRNDFNSIRLLLNLSSEPQQIDFQVEAINGYPNATLAYVPFGLDPSSTPIIIVNTSGWSATQTITIPRNLESPNPTATTNPSSTTASTPAMTPAVSETNSNSTELVALPLGTLAVIIALIILLVVAAVLILVLKRNRR